MGQNEGRSRQQPERRVQSSATADDDQKEEQDAPIAQHSVGIGGLVSVGLGGVEVVEVVLAVVGLFRLH
jgi:hypothetical protein